MEFNILGPIEVGTERAWLELGGRRTRAVLGLLLVRAGQVVPADRFAEELWPHLAVDRAIANLHVRVSELRRRLRAAGMAEGLVTRPPGYQLELGGHELDSVRFEKLLEQAVSALAADDASTARLRAVEALALWRGPVLADLGDVPFVAAEGSRLEELRLTAVEVRLEAELMNGRYGEMLGELAAMTAEHPLRERLWSLRIRALYGAGRQGEALAVYREVRRLLADELGLCPSRELRDLERRVLAQDLATRADPAPRVSGRDKDGWTTPTPQYVWNGTGHIAYQVIGDAKPDIVFVPGIYSHLDLWWEDPNTAGFMRRLAAIGRLIIFDKRDTGLSDPATGEDTLEQRMDDVRAVMDACGSKRAVLIGYSEGGPMSVLFAATFPERVTGLVLFGAAARWTWAPDYPCGENSEAMLAALEQIAQRGWGQGNTMEWYAPSLVSSESARRGLARRERMSVSPSAYLRMLRLVRDIDVRKILPAVSAPALVVQRRNDRVSPPALGRHLAAHLPSARYLEQSGDHLLGVGDVGELADNVEQFVEEAASRPLETNRMLATILVTEVSEAAAPAHHAAAPSAIERGRGSLVETNVQGVVATFDGAARAIRCALTMRADTAAHDFRAGVHVGEVELRDGRLVGQAFELTHQVARLAEKGQILVSRTVKDLVIGSSLHFQEKGSHRLDGCGDDHWMMFTVGG
ncbi:alpha/beta fold hydrolase [Nonomuraea deserti]|uniref:Alpha/beta fold hydrolase n=1 Tax=Nonomuraea deserti TaxID=1848322 RepID=A0A4R4UXF7_9ACTN|nr:alpha/beta fold hydrolase [Nonomuraea deserti]TDC95296.1 alpha/beta fold hydrolase [Nonomuraea deserti]